MGRMRHQKGKRASLLSRACHSASLRHSYLLTTRGCHFNGRGIADNVRKFVVSEDAQFCEVFDAGAIAGGEGGSVT